VRLPGGVHRWIVLRSIDRDEDRWFARGIACLGKRRQGLDLVKRALMTCQVYIQGKTRDVFYSTLQFESGLG